MRRGARRGLTLVEVLVALVIAAGLLALVSGAVFQISRGSARAARIGAEEAAARDVIALIAARLDRVVLVADPDRPRLPVFDLRPDRLDFVTRFVPPAARSGLARVTITARDGAALIRLSDWPRPGPEDPEELRLPAPGLRFAPAGGAPVRGLPAAVAVGLAGRPEQVLPLGAQVPLDCVLAQDPAALALSGGLRCPGVGQ